ncbi:hypothetical protein JW977_02320 [Candidatus Falkowbacteria bacterium]|nr:hypothetical protein [Candidatus Falkowbacteria bacterium]
MAKIVILFKDKNTGKWEKVIAKDGEEKEIIMALHVEESAFVKRYCLIGRGGKTPFDSEEEAIAAKKEEGDIIQAMAPPSNFSHKSEDVEFYYQFAGEEDRVLVDQQGISKEEYDKLPIAEEDMMTDITEEDATPLKEDKIPVEDDDIIEILDGEQPDDSVSPDIKENKSEK